MTDLPDFGHIVKSRKWFGCDMFGVVRLDAEFGDSTVCICWEESTANMICAALNKQMQEAIDATP